MKESKPGGRETKRNAMPVFGSRKQVIRDIILLVTGSALSAGAINGILIPGHFVTGGVAGIILIIHKHISSVNPGLLFLAANIPLFAAAWMVVGRRFFFYSMIGALAISLSLIYVDLPLLLEDRLLSSVLAGLIMGAGAGLCLRTSGSQGGMDILSIMLLRRFSISLGTTILSVNAIVLILVSLFYSLDAVLYSLIVIFVSSKIVSLVVTGLSQRKTVFIISKQWESILREFMKREERGMTILNGRGAYSGDEHQILLAVIKLNEIGQFKRLIQGIDPDAFVVIGDTLEVIHHRIGNQPHW